MASVWIPSLMRDLTGGITELDVPGQTIRELVDSLDARFPGLRDRLCDQERIRPNIAVIVDGIRSQHGLRERVRADSEVHFVPAISGGSHYRVMSQPQVRERSYG